MQVNKTTRTRIKAEDIFDPTASQTTQNQIIDTSFEVEPDKLSTCYTIMGKQDFIDSEGNPVLIDQDDILAEDSDLSFAKIVEFGISGKVKYFVKQGENGRIFNPLGPTDEWTHSKYRHHSDIKKWKYKEVTERVFTLYLKFLKTKNIAYHKNAEREIF